MQTKVTVSLDAKLVEQLRKLVLAGEAKSQSEFFEEALRTKLRRIEWGKWCQEMEDASKDPLFLADQAEIDREFAYADAESAKMIE